jgi:hypothetical protein
MTDKNLREAMSSIRDLLDQTAAGGRQAGGGRRARQRSAADQGGARKAC